MLCVRECWQETRDEKAVFIDITEHGGTPPPSLAVIDSGSQWLLLCLSEGESGEPLLSGTSLLRDQVSIRGIMVAAAWNVLR